SIALGVLVSSFILHQASDFVGDKMADRYRPLGGENLRSPRSLRVAAAAEVANKALKHQESLCRRFCSSSGSYRLDGQQHLRDCDMNKVSEVQAKEIAKLAKLTDEEIDTSDLPEIEDFSAAVQDRFYRPVKQQITLRLDADLLAWLRSQEGKYQSRINEALREYVESHRQAG
ncbi:MAG: hypothetical protein ACI9W2_002576, partial [Gammaproteobacteria bacterium]